MENYQSLVRLKNQIYKLTQIAELYSPEDVIVSNLIVSELLPIGLYIIMIKLLKSCCTRINQPSNNVIKHTLLTLSHCGRMHPIICI